MAVTNILKRLLVGVGVIAALTGSAMTGTGGESDRPRRHDERSRPETRHAHDALHDNRIGDFRSPHDPLAAHADSHREPGVRSLAATVPGRADRTG